MMTDMTDEIEKTLVEPVVVGKSSRRKSTGKSRKGGQNRTPSVDNPWTFSPPSSPESGCHSSVVEHLIGNEEVAGSIPAGSTTQRGDLSEIMVTIKLMRLGASVWKATYGHDHPFDLIAHFGGQLSRVQVKTCRDLDNGSFVINGQRVVDRAGGKQYPIITVDDCDVIVAYHHETAQAYVVRPVGKTRYQLRRTPPKNNQLIGIMYEQDYRLTSLEQIRPAK